MPDWILWVGARGGSGAARPEADARSTPRRCRAWLTLALGAVLPTFASAQAPPAPPPFYQRAAPGRPGWSVDVATGCWVWNSDPRPDDTVSWTGACGPGGLATGRGVEEWRDGNKVSRYEGDVREGKTEGRGVYTFANGDRYEGEFRDDKRHGRGVFVWANGDRYEGEFRDNKRDGRGVFTNVGGSRYDGAWREGAQTGLGVLTYADGGRYEGEWRNGEKNGRGTLVWPSGAQYTGDWRDDLRFGRGIQIWPNGSRYEGEWRAGRPDGFGVAWINGIVIAGTWVAGCFSEEGHRAAIERDQSECP